MPEAAKEIVYTGVGKFVKEKIIDPHTPEAHYQDIMKKYFWVTDRLEGPSFELSQRIRPQVELAAKAAGWSQTFVELYMAGSAIALTAILAGKGIKSAADVFGGMARRHGGKLAGEATTVAAGGAAPSELHQDRREQSSIPLALSKDVFTSRSAEELKMQYGAIFHQVMASQNGVTPWTDEEFFNIWHACVNVRGKAQHDLRHAVLPAKGDGERVKYMDRIFDYVARSGGSVVDPNRKESFLNILGQIDTLALGY